NLRRADSPPAPVFLRRLPGLAARRARLRHGVGRAGGVAQRRPVDHRDRDPRTGQPFSGNQIPAGRISSVARTLLNDLANYPLPNRTVPGGVTGNFVGETALAIRAHQGDARFDWTPSNDNRFVARYSFATYNDRREKNPFPLLFPTRNDQPFWNLGGIWNRVFGPSAMNELLVGYSHTRVLSQTDDWAGVGNADATYGIAGGQPIAGLTCIGSNVGCTAGLNGISTLGAVAPDSNTLAKTFQINDKFTRVSGRHTIKSGGQWLRYDQQRFYAGNNGLLGFIFYNGAFTGSAFADFLLDLSSGKGRGGGDPNDPWTHLQNRIGIFVQDDFKATERLSLNLGLRWAYTSPLVEVDNRQSNFDLVTGRQIAATDGSIEDRALYRPYYKGFEPRLGAA